SPMATICQLKSLTCSTTPAPAMVVPFSSHTATSPVVACRHTRSALPSPFTSPTPTICQCKSGTCATTLAPVMVVPFSSHTATPPTPPVTSGPFASPPPPRLVCPSPPPPPHAAGAAVPPSQALFAVPLHFTNGDNLPVKVGDLRYPPRSSDGRPVQQPHRHVAG